MEMLMFHQQFKWMVVALLMLKERQACQEVPKLNLIYSV